jgi:hypothetical protein
MTALVSRCLSAAGVRFLGILSRPGFRLSHDRPTALTSADTSRVSMFRTHETRLGPDALSTLCVPRISSMALASRVALPAVRP